MPAQTLIEWDAVTRPALQKLECDATWISFYSNSIEETVSKMESVPEWATEAMAHVHEARDRLVAALTKMDAAIMEYDSKRAAA